MPVLKNIIFDWSGTLADDFQPVLEATNEIFRQYGKPAFTPEDFREKFFLPFPDFYKKYLPEATMVQLDHYYHSSFKLLQEKIPLLPYARETLDYCRSLGMKIFLLSTIHPEHYEVQAQRLGVKEYFTKAYVQAVDKRKTIHSLLAEHDLDPRETLFVGDMQHDIETAKHGGLQSCAVLTGYDSLPKLQASEPDLIFKDLLGLKNYIEHHRSEPAYLPVATVGALIRNPAGKLLMIRTYKWSNLWGIPGGKIKTGEKSLDAIVREVREETGLELGNIRFVMVQDCIGSTEFYKPAHFLLLNYVADTDSQAVTLNDEADEYRWVDHDEALQMPINTPTRILLEAVREHICK
ncbi:MAG: HAD hydrolase-like protein [Methylacidiphilales bacterium]|nr:HAD hydrolase-like protein [Candidatus Methylacidiphilales bacterium]